MLISFSMIQQSPYFVLLPGSHNIKQPLCQHGPVQFQDVATDGRHSLSAFEAHNSKLLGSIFIITNKAAHRLLVVQLVSKGSG